MNLKKIINLSPLVDILMIVIFWYIMMSNQTIENNQEAAREEMEAMRTEYEASAELMNQEKDILLLEKEVLRQEIETHLENNAELGNQLQELKNANENLEMLLEQSSSYVYIRLYDGLNKNRIVEVHYEAELIDKFIFSSGESVYLEQKLTNRVSQYAKQGEQRLAVIFIYEGSNAFYTDITHIQNVLYTLRSDMGISLHMINLAK